MEERVIAISGYLTKLAEGLQQLVPEGWLGNEVAITGSPRRWDMAYQRNGTTTVVDYDGDEHYRNLIKIVHLHHRRRRRADGREA